MEKKSTGRQVGQIIHPIADSERIGGKPASKAKSIKMLILISILGILAGFIFSNFKNASGGGSIASKTAALKKVPKTAGLRDRATFKDSTEGMLREGGIEGEGQFHLERPGGESQYVYLTSSAVDLSPYIGIKIKVWGETQKAEKAGWLMDVGSIEVVE